MSNTSISEEKYSKFEKLVRLTLSNNCYNMRETDHCFGIDLCSFCTIDYDKITKQHELDILSKQVDARIEENEMYLRESNRHYYPSSPNDPYIPLVQFSERIGDLYIK